MIFSRRQLLKLPGGSPARDPGGCARRDTRQNVLFVVLDDLNDCIAVNLKGHPQVKTPNLDRLMARGVNFANAHCSASVCAASRNSFLTGLHPTTTGWYSDGDYDDSAERVLGDTPTLLQHFKATGYTTLASGKIFHTGSPPAAARSCRLSGRIRRESLCAGAHSIGKTPRNGRICGSC